MNFDDISLEEIIPMRQEMTISEAFPERKDEDNEYKWDFLTLYGPGGEVIARSCGYNQNQDIYLAYRSLRFISKAGQYGLIGVSVYWSDILKFLIRE